MLAISRRRDLLTGLFSIAPWCRDQQHRGWGRGHVLAAKLLGAAQGLLAVGSGVSVAYQQYRYQVLFAPRP